MAIQRLEEVPAVCMNVDCENYKGFELVFVEDVETDAEGADFVICHYCKKRIFIT